MDKIVSQYTRSPHQNEFYSEQEQQELTEALPPISLNFKLPPLDNVSLWLLFDVFIGIICGGDCGWMPLGLCSGRGRLL